MRFCGQGNASNLTVKLTLRRESTEVGEIPPTAVGGFFQSHLQTAEAGLEQSTHFRGWDFRVLESRFFVGWTLTIHQLPLVGFLAFSQSKS